MAFGVKYRAFFKHVDGLVKEIRLSKEGYAGAVTEWDTAHIGFEKDSGDSDFLFGPPIASTQLRIGLTFSQAYDLREFATTRRTFRCEIIQVVTNEVEFSGWIEPWDAAHPYEKPTYQVSLVANCGLSQLQNKIFKVPVGVSDYIVTGYDIIKECLDKTGLELPIRTSVHTNMAGTAGQDPYKTYTVNYQRFKGLSYYAILETEVSKFNAVLVQWNNRWVIRSKPDHALGTHTGYFEYDFNNTPSSSTSWPLTFLTNTNVGLSLDGGEIRLEPPINKYTVQADLLPKLSGFINSDLQDWDANGLVGWDFSHMPPGNPGWTKAETGDPDYPYALHVEGQQPQWIRMYRKNWFSPWRQKQFEPEVYLQSPTGNFIPSLKTLTVSFEYYTGRNNFIIGIQVFSSQNPKKVRWVQADGTVGTDWMAIPVFEHRKTNTGSQKNIKGKFTVDIDLKYLNTDNPRSDKPWEPYDRVFIRFYKSYGDNKYPSREYTIFNLHVEAESIYDSDEQLGTYTTTIGYDTITEDEANVINLITGDYTAGFSGATLSAATGEPTGNWARRGMSESLSIYKAMMIDRLFMTHKPLRVFDGKIKILPGQPTLSYLHILQFADLDNARFMIVRYKYEEHRRIADIVAIELDYTVLSDIEQESFIGRGNRIGAEDGVYPNPDGDGGGRLSAEQLPVTREDLENLEDENARMPALFEDIPPLIFEVGKLDTKSVNLEEYFSAVYTGESEEENEDFEFFEIDEDAIMDPKDLSLSLVDAPSWVSSVTFDGLVVYVTGKPTKIGTDSVTVEAFDAISETSITARIPVIVYPKTKLVYNLLEVGAGSATLVGPLPGAYPPPIKSEISISIAGPHNFYQFTLEGGGDNGNAFKRTVNAMVPLTMSGVYEMFTEDNGAVLSEGVYRLFVYTAIDDNPVCIQDITFILGDEEFLSKVKFFLTDGGSDIGEIEPSGESIFPDPGAWDNRVVITDVEHDKAIVKLSKPDGTGIHERTITHTSPATTGSYFVYEDDQSHPIGRYNVSVTLFLEGEQVMMRYADFTTIKKAPEAVGGLVQLLTKSASGVNFSVAATLPKTGVSAQTLPPTGWNLGSDAVTDEFDWEGDELFELKGGSLFKVDIATFIGRPSFVEYGFPVTYSDYRAFDNFSSLSIGKIHGNNKTFRYIRSRKLGGQSGDVVAVMQADFSFGTLKPIDDETEVEEPGSGYADFVAGAGMEEVIEDSIKIFNNRVDGLTIEIFEEESPNDPDSPGLNHLRIKEKGVLYKHIQDMPADTVLGRRDTAGTPGPIQIKKLLADVVDGDLVTIDVIKEVLEDSIDGTPNFIPKFGADGHSLVDSIIREVSGKIGIGIGNPFEMLDVQGNIRATGTLISGIADGTPPIAVISSTLVHNLNVDMLDGEHGEYYLNWDNFTNYKSIIVGTGMTGGGLLDQNVNIGLNFTYLDGRYTTSASSAVSWASVNSGGLSKYNTSGAAAPFGGGGTVFHGVFLGHGSNAAYGTSLAFRNGRGFFQSIEAGTWGSWFEIATQTWVTAGFVPLTRTISTGTGLLGGGALSSNLSLTLDYSYLDDRYQPMVGSALPWNSVNTPGTPKFNVSATDGPLGVASVHGIFINHGTNTSFGTSIAFRDGRGFWKSVNGGTWASTWFEFASVKYVEDTYVPLVRTISTGTGLLGGSSLAANISLTLDYTYLDDRYLMNSGISIPWSSINAAAKPRFNVNATDGPMGGTAVHGLFINHNANSNFGTTIAGRNNRLFFQSVENGSWQSWLEIASQSWVNAKQVIAGNGLTGGSSLASDPVITLGTPSTIGNSTSNMVTSTSHTHAIQVSNLVAGSNVTLSASGTGVILGPNNITISVNAFPWPNISSKPTTLSGFGIVDAPTFDYLGIQLGGKENVFSKGSLIQGGGIVLSGTLINRLVGSGDVTISLGSVPWSSLTGVPNTLGGYGLSSTVYTKSEVNALIAGVGGINGSGSNTYHAMWGAGNTLTQSSVMQEVGGQVTISGHLVVQGGAFRPPESTGGLPASGAIEGELRYSTTGKSMNFWNGTAWKKITDS